MEKKNNEIDLGELFFRLINVVRANFWLIVIFFVVGFLLGLVGYFTSKKVFENEMVVSSSILTKAYAEILTDKVNRYLSEGNREVAAKELNVSQETLTGLSRLNIESLSASDDAKESERFIITAETYNQEILPDLQQGLIYYLENNEFAKIRVEQNKSFLSQMIARVNAEIKDMEDWKEKIMNGSFFQTVKGNVMFDPTIVNSKILEMTKEKITLENNLALVNSVQVIEGFSKFTRPSKPILSVSMALGSSMGLLFVGIIIAFKSIRRLLRMADAKQKA